MTVAMRESIRDRLAAARRFVSGDPRRRERDDGAYWRREAVATLRTLIDDVDRLLCELEARDDD